jgi:hypothetical protein
MLKMFPEEAKAMYSAPISPLQAEVSYLGGVNDLALSLIKLLEAASREVDTDRAAAKASIAQASSLLQVQVERTAAGSPSAAIQFLGSPMFENRPWTITWSSLATIRPGS